MPRQQTLLFALKLLAIAEDGRQLLTEEELLEAFGNITHLLKQNIENNEANRLLVEKLAARMKADPNLVN